jgi:hypothetical protein
VRLIGMTTLAELRKPRAAVVQAAEAIEAYVWIFDEAVTTPVKAADARTRPPWLSYRELCDELTGLFGVADSLEMALRELTARLEADEPAAATIPVINGA